MTERNQLRPGRVRRFRDARRWSQQELASVAGLSRPEISAIETGRVVPSVKVALALGRALGVSVEALFGGDATGLEWAWAPRSFPSRVWLATVGQRRLAYPCESGALADWLHDAVVDGECLPESVSPPPTLVLPAAIPPRVYCKLACANEGFGAWYWCDRVAAPWRCSKQVWCTWPAYTSALAPPVIVAPYGNGSAAVTAWRVGPSGRRGSPARRPSVWGRSMRNGCGASPGWGATKAVARVAVWTSCFVGAVVLAATWWPTTTARWHRPFGLVLRMRACACA